METKRSFVLTLTGAAIFIALAVLLFAILRRNLINLPGVPPITQETAVKAQPFGKMRKFATEEEFRAFMEEATSIRNESGGVFMEDRAVSKSAPGLGMENSIGLPVPQAGGGDSAQRVSQTNVQVLGIDEPDIVKTDGDNLYYSSPYRYRTYPMMEKRIAPDVMTEPGADSSLIYPPVPQEPEGGILSIRSFPPQAMKKLGNIPVSGDLLLNGDVLAVFDETNYEKRQIAGYDVKDPARPVKKWSIPYGENMYKVQARLYKNRIYLITRREQGNGFPCPIPLFGIKGEGSSVRCMDVYRPDARVPSDTVYTVSKINPQDGTVEKTVSFVGSAAESVIYMSKENLYAAYHYSGDMVDILSGFVTENRDLFPDTVSQRLAKLSGYQLSQQAKMVELSDILSRFMNGMKNDDKLAFENNLQNRMKDFMAKHARELDKTGIVKIDLDSFSIRATGEVPGKALNQFALDEYDGSLRIATTIGQNSWVSGFGRTADSFSDVYVLNGSLDVLGSVRDLGKTERIYSVRFMAERGYVVTFRQTDPFYVLDLSNPRSPALKGELKIPGYSSYLHPLKEDLLVGVGQESGNVKLSLFDVADPENPREIDKYSMTEFWSEAQNNHHAFLADEQHEAFFMPGSQGGYVFSYAGNSLSMVKAVAGSQVQRAVYINDYLYVIGQDKIVVLNEKDWSQAGALDL